VIPPWGVNGAYSGAPYHLSIRRHGEIVDFDTPGKVTGYPIHGGDTVIMRSSGGGGYGDPLRRVPALVAEDVAHGYVSPAAAREIYGVVLTPEGDVDAAATTARRQNLDRQRLRLRVIRQASLDPYVGLKGRRRILALSPADAQRLGVAGDDLVGMFGRYPAPLRAWVRAWWATSTSIPSVARCWGSAAAIRSRSAACRRRGFPKVWQDERCGAQKLHAASSLLLIDGGLRTRVLRLSFQHLSTARSS